MSFLDRALRMGEGKKFKEYERRVARINAYEEEFSLFQGSIKSHLGSGRQLLNFVTEPDVARLKHHERPVNVFRGFDVLGQFDVQVAGYLPGAYFT